MTPDLPPTRGRRLIPLAVVLLALTSLTSCAAPMGANPPPGLAFPDRGTVAGNGGAPTVAPAGDTGDEDTDIVTRVIDGDTVVLARHGTVRLVGIDTPETVKPNSPVECHGPEASAAAKKLHGLTVRLETDPVAGEFDRYGRRLAYLWYLDENGTWTHYNLEAVTRGDARPYAYNDQAYRHRGEFEDAGTQARTARLGLWTCPGN